MVETIKDDEVGLYADFDNRQRIEAVRDKRRSSRALPVIDFSAYTKGGTIEARRRVARDLASACTDTGFFYLAGHGISEAEFDIAHAWGHVFFELPRAEKSRCSWTPIGGRNPAVRAAVRPTAGRSQATALPRSRGSDGNRRAAAVNECQSGVR